MPHFQLVVPNYDQSTGADHPLTYVRLGQAWAANETLTEEQRADALLTEHLGFKDDERFTQTRHKTKTYHRDDGVSCTTDKDANELTAELLTRGGVREHTDGDRISTTRGDYLGVVFGNYKLVIMGRVEGDNVGTSYWESSGGHNHDITSTPGEVKTITWTEQHEDNTWTVTHVTEKGEEWSYFEGRKQSTYFGPKKSETIGASKAPKIKDVTYCQKKEAVEVYDTKTDTTQVNGNVTEHAQVIVCQSDKLFFKGSGTIEDTEKTLGTHSSHTLAIPLVTSQAMFGAHYERYGGAFTTKLNIDVMTVSLTLGLATTFRFFHFAFPFKVAETLDISLAGALTLEIGATFKAVFVKKEEIGVNENELTILDLRIKAARKKMHALVDDASPAEFCAAAQRFAH